MLELNGGRYDEITLEFFSPEGQNLGEPIKARYVEERSDPDHDIAILTFDPKQLVLPMPMFASESDVLHNAQVVGWLRPVGSEFGQLVGSIGAIGSINYPDPSRPLRVWPLHDPNTSAKGISGTPIVLQNGEIIGLTFAGSTEAPDHQRQVYVIPSSEWLNRISDLRPTATPLTRLHSEFQGRVNSCAPCCVELAGDGTVLVTGKVLLATLPIYVHVAIEHTYSDTKFEVYRHMGEGELERDYFTSDNFRDTFAPIFDASRKVDRTRRQALTRSFFEERYLDYLGSYNIMVVFEAPIGVGILEESAFAVALSRALIKLRSPGEIKSSSSDACAIPVEQGLAALLLSAWHTHMSWATIVGSMREPSSHKLIWFERSIDAPDLLVLYRDPNIMHKATEEVFRQNSLPERTFWHEASERLDGILSVWYTNSWLPALCQLPEENDTKANAIERLREPIVALVNEYKHVFLNANRERSRRIGLFMQMHQLLLELAKFPDPGVQVALAKVNGLDQVYGAKLACARGCGAIVVLMPPNQLTLPPPGPPMFRELTKDFFPFNRLDR